MSGDDDIVPLRPDKNQRTLFSLSKVVRMTNLSMCFTLEEISAMKKELLVPSQTMHQVRTLDQMITIFKQPPA